MATMNISLPDEMKAWVEEQVETGAYAGASDVVRDAVRRSKSRKEAIVRLNEEIENGIDSGFVAPEDRQAFKARMRASKKAA